MICKLCLQEKILCKKSHIIPNFMYRELFDEAHRLIKFDLKNTEGIDSNTGEFESNLLCKECENKLSKWETYAKTVLYGGYLPKNSEITMQNYVNPHGVEYTQLTGVDYLKFKLFLLSILWRASVSTRNFFSKVNLGSYQEKIRKMLINENPGKTDSYPCVISTYRKLDLPSQIIGEPRKISKGGTRYAFLINGLLIVFYISHKVVTDWVLEATMNEQGEIKIIHMPRENGKRMLNSFFGEEILM